MAPSVKNVVVGKPLATGAIFRAPLGSTMPTDSTTALDAAFVGLGYANEDGLTETVDRETDKIKAWGGDIVKVVQTDFSVSYQFTLIEALKGDVLKAAYGDDNVTVTAASSSAGNLTAVKIGSDQLEHFCWVFDMKDGDSTIRISVPNGQVTTIGEVSYTDSAVAGMQLTLEAFADDNGFQAYKYTDDGQKTTTP